MHTYSSSDIPLDPATLEFVENSLHVMPSRYDVVDVTFDTQESLFCTYVDAFVNGMSCSCSEQGIEFALSEAEMRQYLATLLDSRITWVNNTSTGLKPTVSHRDRVIVPMFFYLLLAGIGRYLDVDLGLELRPKLRNSIETMDINEVNRVSAYLSSLSEMFYHECGYRKDRSGSGELMSMAVINDFVMGQSVRDDPLHAIFAGTLNLMGIEAVIKPRVKFAPLDQISSIVSILATGGRRDY